VVIKSATLPTGIRDLSCTELSSNHRIYCFGGYNGSTPLNTTIEYNPATNLIVTKNARFPLSLFGLACSEMSTVNRIYCFGGYSWYYDLYNQTYLDKVFEYNPVADSMALAPETFSGGRHSLACSEQSSTGKIYCFGGARSTVYYDQVWEYS
jgi:N-acetylneuraminic acid mutarotase